jgi:heme exporter protein A
MLEAINLSCVRGDRRLFSSLNFRLTHGSVLQVTGANGSGKTSLLRLICGLASPEQGEVRWQGANIRSLGEEYYTAIHYVGHRNGLKEELTSLENLTISSGLSGKRVSKEVAKNILDRMGLAGRHNLAARLLSEGQRRRLALSRLLSCTATVWILDEMFTSLDKAAVGLMTSLLKEHLGNDGMAIVATHHELELKDGELQRLDLSPDLSEASSDPAITGYAS